MKSNDGITNSIKAVYDRVVAEPIPQKLSDLVKSLGRS